MPFGGSPPSFWLPGPSDLNGRGKKTPAVPWHAEKDTLGKGEEEILTFPTTTHTRDQTEESSRLGRAEATAICERRQQLTLLSETVREKESTTRFTLVTVSAQQEGNQEFKTTLSVLVIVPSTDFLLASVLLLRQVI